MSSLKLEIPIWPRSVPGYPILDLLFYRQTQEDTDGGETVVVKFFTDLAIAQLYSAYLSEHHIQNYLLNQFLNQLLPGVEGIELRVRKIDYHRAKWLIEQLENPTDKISATPHHQTHPYSVWKIVIVIFIVILTLGFLMLRLF